MHPKARALHPKKHRVYVTVKAVFDSTGHVSPLSVTWVDGRTFVIEQVLDYRPCRSLYFDLPGDCYTVKINGQTTHLFFERVDPLLITSVGRWFVITLHPPD